MLPKTENTPAKRRERGFCPKRSVGSADFARNHAKLRAARRRSPQFKLLNVFAFFAIIQTMENKNAWEKYDDKKSVMDFAEEYREFISANKTERECVEYFKARAEKNGFVSIEEARKSGKQLRAGDKVYVCAMEKILALFQIGSGDLQEGMNILGAHVDSPRLDIKQNPLYESDGLAFLDTHYYGGIKKYQWVTTPLSLRGVVAKKDGSKVRVSIGDGEGEAVFGVSDLLIHLSAEQLEKRASKVVEGEALNILVGSVPLKAEKDSKEKKNPVKENILKILKEKYGIDEADFVSAELEAVPAGEAKNYGFDSSMIMAYGQDDRVCAYPSFRAIENLPQTERTALCLLVDKEEIGSVGATGMHSRFFENAVAEVYDLLGGYSELGLRRCLANSQMLSSDVSAAFDPNYPEVMEKNNCCYLCRGIALNKFTGSRGKSGSNDANAEYIARIRKIFDDAGVSFQMTEMGKVDAGGGGTIAYIMANYGMNVIDSGVGVLNMHSPWEITSKVDIYESFKGYRAFLESRI